ncbi:hypothetical protein [Calidifontibacillus oryziterrae]|uniref:hypothetical protein n=1 Tax=Calidifontibacillus oryziterrae TaxID=1191699 RepID=UPI0002DC6D05|nr:hypothetical protein [Calidifontibacillus oryziterrae]
MDMISIIASIILVLGCLYIVLSPLIGRNNGIGTDHDFSKVASDDQISKQELYATLNEIEMDYKMNKLSEDDYKKMKKAYELMVAEIISKEQKHSGKKGSQRESADFIKNVEDEIDQELEALRKERRLES